MKLWHFAALFSISATIAVLVDVVRHEPRYRVTRQEAIEAAIGVAKQLSYDTAATRVECVRDKGGYVVHFSPRTPSFGGGLWVRIRATDGTVVERELTQ